MLLAVAAVAGLRSAAAQALYSLTYNDLGEYVGIAPFRLAPRNSTWVLPTSGRSFVPRLVRCPEKHTDIFVSEPGMPLERYVSVELDGVTHRVLVDFFPSFPGSVLMSTLIGPTEDWTTLRWVQFHRALGVAHFVVYLNAPAASARVRFLLQREVREGVVVLIDWPFPYFVRESGFSAQTTSQNHALYTFRKASFIGLMDVDEYVNILSGPLSIPSALASVVASSAPPVGGVRLLSRIFSNPGNVSETGFEFLRASSCSAVIRSERQKVFARPLHVQTFAVHKITSGEKMVNAPAESVLFNHYMFLKKPKRARDPLPFYDTSILRAAEQFGFVRS